MGVALVPEALALAPLAGVRHLALAQRVPPSQTFAVWRSDGGAPVAALLAHLTHLTHPAMDTGAGG
jgi:hypothetical protein